jgi:hypothetical protein
MCDTSATRATAFDRLAKLNASLVAVFIVRIKAMDLAIDQAVEELQHVHGLA